MEYGLCDPAGLRRYGWRELCVGGLLIAGPLALWMSYLWVAAAASGSVIGARNFAAPLTGYSVSWGETLFELREAPSRDTWFKLLALISLGTQAMVLVVLGNLTILDGLTALCVIDWPARLNTLNAR